MTSPTMQKVFEYTITVQQEHIDGLQHVNNVVYVQFMQEAADKHWHSVTAAEPEHGILWVVRRHEVDYFVPALLHEQLLIRTWTGEHSAVTWDRHYEIIRVSDQKRVISAKSVWVLLDKLTGRPMRINEKILARFA